MEKKTTKQIFYIIGVIATIIIAIKYILPVLLKLTGIILALAIFTAIVIAIIYSIVRLSEMIKK